jgi:hypothetical protein
MGGHWYGDPAENPEKMLKWHAQKGIFCLGMPGIPQINRVRPDRIDFVPVK